MSRSLVRNSGWNLSGYVLPALAAFACTPFLYRAFGAERFGILSLAWALLGIFTLFDFGIGRALTRRVAELRGQHDDAGIATATAVALVVSLLLGFVVSLVLLALFATTGSRWFTVPADLLPEFNRAALILVAGVWLSIYGSALRGGLEGFEDFRSVNLVKIPAGIAVFLLPTLTALVTPDLSIAVAALVASRILANGAMGQALRRLTTPNWAEMTMRRGIELLGYGGWITVSNFVGPIIVYADRFVIGSLLGPATVPFFSVPSDALSRVSVLPASVATAALPAIAGQQGKSESIWRIIASAMRLVILTVIPLTLAALLLARPVLDLWMGESFANQSVVVFRWLAIGFGINALAQVPFLALQAIGQARLTGLWHLVQLVPYLVALVMATRWAGIEGAAAAFTIRSTIDMAGMWVLLTRSLKATKA